MFGAAGFGQVPCAVRRHRMKFISRILAAAFLALYFCGASKAAVVTSYTLDRLFGPLADATARVTDIDVDTANRVWFTTNKVGVTALSGNTVASGFPLFLSLTDADFTPNLSSVAFGPVGAEKQPNFFLGANGSVSGVLYGRMLATGMSLAVDHTLNAELNSPPVNTTRVNVMAKDEETRIWLGTDLGLTWVELPNLTVATTIHAPGVADKNILHVVDSSAAQTGAEAFFSTANGLYLVRPSPQNDWFFFTYSNNLNGIGGIAVDLAGNLWVAEAGFGSITKSRVILRFAKDDIKAWVNGGVEPTPAISRFDPGDLARSVYNDERFINTLEVSPSTGDVWLGTTLGAFFQKPDLAGQMSPHLCGQGLDWDSSLDDEDAAGDPCTATATGWRPTPQSATETTSATTESFGAIYLDELGNSYLGSNRYIRAIISRNLSMSGTRFIGENARVTLVLLDDTVLPANAKVTVKVDANSRDITMTQTEPGRYVTSFGFTFSGTFNPVDPQNRFPVTSSKASTIDVSYTFVDDANVTHVFSLPTATWVEIAPFQDDLWLGGGPCMIKTLDR